MKISKTVFLVVCVFVILSFNSKNVKAHLDSTERAKILSGLNDVPAKTLAIEYFTESDKDKQDCNRDEGKTSCPKDNPCNCVTGKDGGFYTRYDVQILIRDFAGNKIDSLNDLFKVYSAKLDSLSEKIMNRRKEIEADTTNIHREQDLILLDEVIFNILSQRILYNDLFVRSKIYYLK